MAAKYQDEDLSKPRGSEGGNNGRNLSYLSAILFLYYIMETH